MKKAVDCREINLVKVPLPVDHQNVVNELKGILKENSKSDDFFAYHLNGMNWLAFERENLPYINNTLSEALKKSHGSGCEPQPVVLHERDDEFYIDHNFTTISDALKGKLL